MTSFPCLESHLFHGEQDLFEYMNPYTCLFSWWFVSSVDYHDVFYCLFIIVRYNTDSLKVQGAIDTASCHLGFVTMNSLTMLAS